MLPGDRQDKAELKGAGFLASIVFLLIGGITWVAPGEPATKLWPTIAAGVIALITFLIASRKHWRRKSLINTPFPQNWRTILQQEVVFYQSLDPAEKTRFENMVQLFLAETRITGIQTEIDDRIKVLVAASGIIPVFGMPGWEYFNLGEVLIVPDSWKLEHSASGAGVALGQVQGLHNKQYMRLSKAALLRGFQDMKDRKNVGIHEFAHVIDAVDGEIDGFPEAFLPEKYRPLWREEVKTGMQRILEGKSRMRKYGATNEAEFFAVSTEYFFENPKLLKQDHPQLYGLLTQVYRQRPASQIDLDLNHYLYPYGKRIGRNSPCPCGSGKKYKKCCLGS